MRRSILAFLAVLVWSASAFAQAKLQIHHIDVGQGDAAVMVTPGGQTVLFDVGKDLKRKSCTPALSYLDQLGVAKIDALFVSHYHYDHVGCVSEVLARFPLKSTGKAYDRGGSYKGPTFDGYKTAVGSKRREVSVGDTFTFDKTAANPVTVSVIAVNAKSQTTETTTSDENDLSVAVLVSYGQFREEIGGDLSGENKADYKDIETAVAGDIGPIDIYKVHHHCSSYSTNVAWLTKTKPTIGIISTGDNNGYDHPAADCLQRLRNSGLKKVFWTERGVGSPKAGFDVIGGNIIVEVASGGASYTVASSTGAPEAFTSIASAPPTQPPVPTGTPKFAWSSKASKYHLAACSYVASISPTNLQRGDTPPSGKSLHSGCPTGQ